MSGLPFSLEDLMSRDVKAWIPNKEADHPRSITGTVVKVTTTTSDYSDAPVPVLEIVPDEPGVIWRVTAFGTVLAREIAEQRPVQGDKVGLRYEGKGEGVRGTYEKFRVVVQRAEQPVVPIDWESIERAAAAEMDEEDPPEEERF